MFALTVLPLQVLEWLQEENLRSYAPIFVHHRLDSLEYVTWQDRAAVGRTGCQLARIGRRLTRIGRQLARIGRRLTRIGRQLARIGRQLTRIGRQLARIERQLARIGRRLEENLRSWAPIFVHLDSLEYVHHQPYTLNP